MAKSPYRPYTPNPEQVALMPDESGNAINGLDEKEFRKAAPIYWHDPETLAHGEMQKWFYTQNADHPDIAHAREARARILEIAVPPVSGSPQEKTAQEWTEALSAHAGSVDMELFGITAMNPDWTFAGENVAGKWVVMIGVAHDYEKIKAAPDLSAGAEVIRQYGRGIMAAKDIATWIRGHGWDAAPYGGPEAGPLLLIPPAIDCGFGELGKHGSIINKEFGSSFRLAAVVTELPLVPTSKEIYNVDDFCMRCQVCANACPPDAIAPDKQWVRGNRKWYVDFDKCITFFNENFGCAICISVCPWSIPGRGPRIVEQLLRRSKKKEKGF